jgi:starvation-inducible DNA-binding protein
MARKRATNSSKNPKFTVPGMSLGEAGRIVDELDVRLAALVDLAMTLKHIHWNVVGPLFIAAHEMLDDHLEKVLPMVDETAERIATLGGHPDGTPGHLVDVRTWNDYDLGKASVPEHMAALDVVYTGIIEDHRKLAESLGETDLVTQDMLVGQLGTLELLQWLVRAHVESTEGVILTTADTERAAAQKARAKVGGSVAKTSRTN